MDRLIFKRETDGDKPQTPFFVNISVVMVGVIVVIALYHKHC